MKKIIVGAFTVVLVFAATIGVIDAQTDFVNAWLRANAGAASDSKSLLVEISASTDDFAVGGDLTVTGTSAMTGDVTLTDDLLVGGWYKSAPTIVSAAAYTISSTGKAGNYLIEVSDTGTYSVWLPEAPGDGTEITIIDNDLNASSNNGTIYPYGGSGDTILETTSFTQDADGESTTFLYSLTNTNWSPKAGYGE